VAVAYSSSVRSTKTLALARVIFTVVVAYSSLVRSTTTDGSQGNDHKTICGVFGARGGITGIGSGATTSP
jgi:hypothetical protein